MMLIRNPLAWYVLTADHNEVARRALVQVLALRAWQLKHGGQFPKSLDALVPEELPSLPDDPYSGQPFGYAPSNGQEVTPFRYARMPAQEREHATTTGSWLIYSVGPDFHDDGGMTFVDKKNLPKTSFLKYRPYKVTPALAKDTSEVKIPPRIRIAPRRLAGRLPPAPVLEIDTSGTSPSRLEESAIVARLITLATRRSSCAKTRSRLGEAGGQAGAHRGNQSI
jgi:hypothetical protein